MLNNTAVQPALTAEEWETWRKEGHVTRNDQVILHSKGIGFAGVPRISAYMVPMDTETHACAAVCLDSQPFGFTREDLRVLDMASYRYGFCPRTESCNGCDQCNADWERFLSVRARIEALLPPE